MHLMKNVGHKVILTQRTILFLWTPGSWLCIHTFRHFYSCFSIQGKLHTRFFNVCWYSEIFCSFQQKKGSPTRSSNCLGHFHTSCPMGRGREGGWGGMLHKYLRFRVFGCLMLRYFLLQFLSNQFLLRRPICIVII